MVTKKIYIYTQIEDPQEEAITREDLIARLQDKLSEEVAIAQINNTYVKPFIEKHFEKLYKVTLSDIMMNFLNDKPGTQYMDLNADKIAVKFVEHLDTSYDGWSRGLNSFTSKSRLSWEIPLANGKTLSDPLYSSPSFYDNPKLLLVENQPSINERAWKKIQQAIGFIFHNWLVCFLNRENNKHELARSIHFLMIHPHFLKYIEKQEYYALCYFEDLRTNMKLYKGPLPQGMLAQHATSTAGLGKDLDETARAVKVIDARLRRAIQQHQHEMRMFSAKSKEEIERDYPYLAPGNIWGIESASSLVAPTSTIPSPGMRPGIIAGAVTKALKAECDNHIYSLLQHTSTMLVHIVIEPKRNPVPVDRQHDARLIMERREAIKELLDAYAEELGIVMIVESIEMHGATRDKKGTTNKEVKEQTRKKKKGINQKKRNLNPKGGGDPERSDSEQEDRIAWEENAALELKEQADLEKATSEARLARLNLLNMRMRKALTGENEKRKIGPEGDEIGQYLWKDFNDRVEAWKKAQEKFVATLENTIKAELEVLHEQRNVYIQKRKDNGGTLLATDNSKLMRIEKAIKQLALTLPNARVNLSHHDVVVMQKLNQKRAFDPDRLPRLFSAPLILHCRCNPLELGGDFTCDYCGRTPKNALEEHMSTECTKRTNGAACYFRAPCCARLGKRKCHRRHTPDYYADPAKYEHDHQSWPFPEGDLNMGALLFSVLHGGGLNFEDVLCNCNMNRTKYAIFCLSSSFNKLLWSIHPL